MELVGLGEEAVLEYANYSRLKSTKGKEKVIFCKVRE
jgi:hypothetical protein